MLAPYATVASSTSGLNTKVNIADTASMLNPYASTQRMTDSLTAMRNSIGFFIRGGKKKKRGGGICYQRTALLLHWIPK